MKLVVVEVAFPPADREDAVALFRDRADAVRAMDGCERYAVRRSVDDEGGVAIVQRWAPMDASDAYRASDAFAALGRELKPMMSAPPSTTAADVDG